MFVNAISRELVFRPADGVANDGIVYHSKNLTKLSQLTNDVVPSWALATTNHYLPYDDTRNTNYAPYNSNTPKGLTTVHLKNTGIDGLADGGNFHSSIYITPWMDTSGGHAHNIAFTDNGNMWMRHGTASWSEWVKVYHSGNFNPDNYLPLAGGKTITGDFQFQDGVAVRDATGKNVVGLLDVAGYGVCVAVGNGVKKTRIVTPNDTPVYRNDGKGAYRIYDSSNFNPDNYLLKTANAVSASKWATARTLTLTGSASGNVSMDGSANVSLSVTNNRLNSNSEMTYGWNGINYFNLAGTAGAAAKINDTPTTAWWHILRFNHGNSAGYYTDLAVPFNDNTLYYKRVTSGTLQNGGWVKIWDEKNANLSTVDWAAKNITAAGTVTATKLVIGGITIDVYNGALRVNGNLVATGGVTAYQ